MSDIKLDSYSETLKNLIKNYHLKVTSDEYGYVVTNFDGILNISGLENVFLNEVLIIDNSLYALVLTLNPDLVGAVMLSNYDLVQEGMKVKRSYKTFEAPVGDVLIGRVINVFGDPIDDEGSITIEHKEPVEKIAPGVMERESVTEPLYTGILAVDALIPIGKGQRELIIGDRQTGKTSLAVDAIINQKGKDCFCVYVSIGQKNSTLFRTIQRLKNKEALKYTTVVSASASDLPSLKFLAPFVGITIAEYWMKKGKDVLIVYDDLTQHAISYRTLSLLLNFPPGREAFPGDIFYLHSRLLERAGRLNQKNGGGSITALPIIETQADDISAYIPSNVISITDGQIFLKSVLFNSGQKPAVDVTHSVSRVGGAAQKKAIKTMSSNLRLSFTQYFELLEFSHFGSDLNENTKRNILLGERITKCMVQKLHSPLSPTEELFLLFLIKEEFIMKITDVEDVVSFVELALSFWNDEPLSKDINFDEAVSEDNLNIMRNVADNSITSFYATRSK